MVAPVRSPHPMRNVVKSLPVVQTAQRDLAAGSFSAWLRQTRAAHRGKDGVDVPCGECTACCESSYFIHIAPDETEALSRIPQELLFPAPGLPRGHVLLGYDEDGHCPMLIDQRCSIYEDRPLTCRNYDCRVFTATGIRPGDDKALIQRQTRRWEFDYPTGNDRDEHRAVRAAARFLQERGECFDGGVPRSPSQLAILAVKAYEVFLPGRGEPGKTRPDSEVARAVVDANAGFEPRSFW